jgi:hypothetical protein
LRCKSLQGPVGRRPAAALSRLIHPPHLRSERTRRRRQLEERRAGDAAQRRGDHAAALARYARAAAILSFVRGATREDAGEVARCRARLAWAEAGARMGQEEWGAAARACADGLAALRAGCGCGEGAAAPLEPELEACLLLRRAEALLARDEAEVRVRARVREGSGGRGPYAAACGRRCGAHLHTAAGSSAIWGRAQACTRAWPARVAG